MDKDNFFLMILAIVDEIPIGKVSCYSDIAHKSGYPKNARLVGKILSNSEYYGTYPCHRVIHKDGRLVNGWDNQQELLENEGITFLANGRVNMKKYRW